LPGYPHYSMDRAPSPNATPWMNILKSISFLTQYYSMLNWYLSGVY